MPEVGSLITSISANSAQFGSHINRARVAVRPSSNGVKKRNPEFKKKGTADGLAKILKGATLCQK